MSLPQVPGVYWFLDDQNKVLYVGKAKNLNNRLRSYARHNQLLPKTRQLLSHTKTVKYEPLESELEALLTEAELIKLHQPHYNILLKDDKSPLYIITTKETYPRVLSVRKPDLTGFPIRHQYGPFPSGLKVKQILQIARKIFPFCNSKGKPCFYRHLELCPGACTGEITPTAYTHTIRQLELFLTGKHQQVIKNLKQEIEATSQNEEYEKAATLKEKIETINYINRNFQGTSFDSPLPNLTEDIFDLRRLELERVLKQKGVKVGPLKRIECYDVANLMGQSAAVSMVVAMNGQNDSSEYKHFGIKTLSTPNDVGMLKEALGRRLNHPEWGIPDLIVIDGGKPQVNAIQSIMTWSTPVVGIAKQPNRLVIIQNGITTQIPLDPSHPVGQLLISLRDEAHRFSRRLHHNKSTKKLLED